MQVESFVLASASPRRRELLERAGYRFEVQPSRVQEPDPASFSPSAYVHHTAWLKASDVAQRVDVWVLAGDTVATLNGQILGKPNDRDDARRILTTLQGTVHQVLTGTCLYVQPEDVSLCAVDVTEVEMRPLSTAQIEEYLQTQRWRGKAGAYGIQDSEDPFVAAVVGSYTNVMGLPIERVEQLFEAAHKAVARPT